MPPARNTAGEGKYGWKKTSLEALATSLIILVSDAEPDRHGARAGNARVQAVGSALLAPCWRGHAAAKHTILATGPPSPVA